MASNDLIQSQRKPLPILLNPEDCHGKNFIVTGATSGLGLECTKHLVRLGARVIMAVRDTDLGRSCRASIESETECVGSMEVWYVNLSRYDTIKAFVNKAEAELDRIDGLLLNAGVSNGKWEIQEGMESNLTVNLISNMLLTTLMVPVMEKKGRYLGITSRIVHVGSRGAFLMPKPPHAEIDKADILADLNDKKKWEQSIKDRYILSKLLQHFAVRQLAAEVPVSKTGVTINITDPGLCKTGLMRSASWSSRLLACVAKLVMGRTSEMGSRTLLAGLAVDDSHGKFLTDCEVSEHKLPKWMTDESGREMQTRLWEEIAAKLEAIEPGCIETMIKK